MDPGHVLALAMGVGHLGHYLVQGQGRGVDHPGVVAGMGDHLAHGLEFGGGCVGRGGTDDERFWVAR